MTTVNLSTLFGSGDQQGYTGSQGAGYTGSKGDPGAAGSPGDPGPAGSPGDPGYVGSQGSTGYTGSRGDKGDAGGTGTFSGTTDQAIVTTNTTSSTDTSTGALQVAGGAGIVGNLNVGGTITVSTKILPLTSNIIDIGSPTQRFGKLYLAGNTIDLGGATISGTVSGGLMLGTSSGNIDITANTVNFLNTVSTTETHAGNLNIPYSITTGNIYTNNYFYANGTPYYNTGYTGSAGTNGYTGSAGSAGVAGADGAIGYTGSRGTDGVIGVDGAAGYTGSIGANGYTGSVGMGFTVAKTYSSVAALTADTSPVDIAPGQFALIETGNTNNIENSKLYVWSGTTYNFVTDLSGAAGITGAAGSTGYTGSQGEFGYTGSAGANGINGTIGTNGYAGSIGEVGYTGSLGYTGSTGATGTGYTGSVGYTGSIGAQGANGTTGGGFVNLTMSGPVSPPVTGTARFYSPISMIINTVYANLSTAPLGGNLTFIIKKNGTNIGTTFAMDSTLMTPVSVTIILATTDYLTLDVGGGSATDLNVKLKYV